MSKLLLLAALSAICLLLVKVCAPPSPFTFEEREALAEQFRKDNFEHKDEFKTEPLASKFQNFFERHGEDAGWSKIRRWFISTRKAKKDHKKKNEGTSGGNN